MSRKLVCRSYRVLSSGTRTVREEEAASFDEPDVHEGDSPVNDCIQAADEEEPAMHQGRQTVNREPDTIGGTNPQSEHQPLHADHGKVMQLQRTLDIERSDNRRPP